jgi:hypothetical protein
MADEITSGVKPFPEHEPYPEHGGLTPAQMAAATAARAHATAEDVTQHAAYEAAKAATAAKAPPAPAPVVVPASVSAPKATPMVNATQPRSKSTPPTWFSRGPAPKQSA